MSETEKPRQRPAEAGGMAAAARKDRLGAALRANLARRKAQMRQRAAASAAADEAQKPRR